MRINWCEEHGVSAVEDLQHCWKRQWLFEIDPAFEHRRDPCRMVEMHLVPADSWRMRDDFTVTPTAPAPYDIEIPDFVNRQGNW